MLKVMLEYVINLIKLRQGLGKGQIKAKSGKEIANMLQFFLYKRNFLSSMLQNILIIIAKMLQNSKILI